MMMYTEHGLWERGLVVIEYMAPLGTLPAATENMLHILKTLDLSELNGILN